MLRADVTILLRIVPPPLILLNNFSPVTTAFCMPRVSHGNESMQIDFIYEDQNV